MADVDRTDARQIPDAFRGRWVLNAQSCATTDDMDDTIIDRDGYHDIQTLAKVKRVSKTGPHSIHLELTESDEGDRGSSFVEDWTLDTGGDRLTQIVYYDGPGTNRLVRCR